MDECRLQFVLEVHLNPILSAVAPLPDNLEEYMFAGFLGRRRLRIAKALTQDLMVPADADIVIEGYVEPGETKQEGPFGDHFGFYSLTGQYPTKSNSNYPQKERHAPCNDRRSTTNGGWLHRGSNR